MERKMSDRLVIKAAVLPGLLAAGSAVLTLSLSQSLIDFAYQGLQAISFPEFLLKTQHLSFVHDYLVQSDNEQRWHRIALHYALCMPILFYLWFLIISVGVDVYHVVGPGESQPREPKKISRFIHALVLICVPMLLWGYPKFSHDLLMDLVTINPETMAGHPRHFTGRHSWIRDILYQSEIHRSNPSFFHLSLNFLLQGVFFIPLIVGVGLYAKAIKIHGFIGTINRISSGLSQRTRNYASLYLPALSFAFALNFHIPDSCFTGPAFLLYSLIPLIALPFYFVLIILAFRDGADDVSYFFYSLLCSALFLAWGLNFIFAQRASQIIPGCITP